MVLLRLLESFRHTTRELLGPQLDLPCDLTSYFTQTTRTAAWSAIRSDVRLHANYGDRCCGSAMDKESVYLLPSGCIVCLDLRGGKSDLGENDAPSSLELSLRGVKSDHG
jgi:hypothetical protein